MANLAKVVPSDYWIPAVVSFQSKLRYIGLKKKKKTLSLISVFDVCLTYRYAGRDLNSLMSH